MTRNLDINVPRPVLERVIRLANAWASEQYGESKRDIAKTLPIAGVPTAEQALKLEIDSLPLTEAREIHALMYLGREGAEGLPVSQAFALFREGADTQEEVFVKASLCSKVQLASYLTSALNLLNAEAF